MAIDKKKAAEARKRQADSFITPPIENPEQETSDIQLETYKRETNALSEPEKKKTKRDTHKVYSFWAKKEDIAMWNAYIKNNPELEKKEDLGLNAIAEYIENHPIPETRKETFAEDLQHELNKI